MEAYLGLFISAFLAATLVPAYSEILFASLIAGGYDPLALWLWASSGNTLGSAVNWALGRYLLHFQDRGWFPFKAGNLDRAQTWFQKFGVWSLLFAWLPIGGDALTFIAGVTLAGADTSIDSGAPALRSIPPEPWASQSVW